MSFFSSQQRFRDTESKIGIHAWISLETKLRFYNTCILPIYLCETETWSVAETVSREIDSLDNWSLEMHLTEFITSDEGRSLM